MNPDRTEKNQRDTDSPVEQLASRPSMPASYGLHEAGDGKSLLPWTWAEARLASARNYWVATTRPDGRPHSMPVWGVWLQGAFYFGASRDSRKARNVVGNPEVVLHLESGDEVVILEGSLSLVRDLPELEAYASAYQAKYEWRPDPAAVETVTYRLQPRVGFAWLEGDFPRTATRWQFDPSQGE